MKIVRLEATNVKRLRAVRIIPDPEGHMVVLGGRNAQGKSSAIDCVEMGLGGASRIPGDPVRHGEEKGKITIEMDTGLVIKRSLDPDRKTSIVVRAKDGGKHGQGFLDGLVAPRSLDPLSFLGMKPEKQVAELLALVGLDFSKLDADAKGLYDRRTDENREVRRAKDEVELIGDISDTPETPVVVAELLAEQKLRQIEHDNLVSLRGAAATKRQEVERTQGTIAGLESELATLRMRLENASAALLLDIDTADSLEKQANETPEPALEEIADQIAAAEGHNASYQLRVRAQAAEADVVDLQKKADALTNQIEAVETTKKRQLAEADFPVDGLGFEAGQVMYQGVPFSQASRAEQIRVATSMAFATNPKLKIALVRDGSVLDDESLAIMGQVAEEAGGQLWIEMARGAPDGSFIIEDGMVVE